jgi:hypothetical protein
MSRQGSGPVRLVAVGVLALALGLPAGAGAAASSDGERGASSGAAAEPTWAVPDAPQTLVVSTEGAAPVVSKDDYLAATVQLAGATLPAEIRGRGNSTWKWPKKPYKLKLEEEASLLGLPVDDEWVLLANYADRSGLRNHLAFQLAQQTRLAWTPETRYVELVLNGVPQGLYVLTEQVEQGETRVALPKGGYLLEVDERFRASGDPGFRTRRRTPVSFQDPDELERPERRRVKKAFNAFEDVLYGDRFADPVRGYAPRIDVASFVDWYVVEELFRNQDSNFHSSVNVTWTPGGVFALGPVWDFDQSAGTRWNAEQTPQGWHTRRGRHWIARMMEDPSFSTLVKQRFLDLRPVFEELVAQVPAAAGVVRTAAQADWSLWHTSGAALSGGVHAPDLDGEVAFLHRWLADRTAWVTAPEVTFAQASAPVRESAQVLQVPVRVLGASAPVSVDYAVAGGSAAVGEDYAPTEGTLRFEPGETVKTFPVTLLDDGVAEREEKLHLTLRSSSGARLGHPQRLTLTVPPNDLVPDAQVRTGSGGRFSGVRVRDPRGRGQTVRTTLARGGSRSFEVRVVNDRRYPGTFRLRGDDEGRGSRVRWFHDGDDVTAKVTSGRGLRVRIRPDGAAGLRAVVRLRAGASVGKVHRLHLDAALEGEPGSSDRVRVIVRARR